MTLPETISLTLSRAENVGHDGTCQPAYVLDQRYLRLFNLVGASNTPQLQDRFDRLINAGRSARIAPTFQSAKRA